MEQIKTYVKNCIRALGWDVRKLEHANTEQEVLKSVLSATLPVAVLDVGANIGQYAKLIRSSGYRGLIVSFEAIPGIHAQLTQQAKKDESWMIAPCAALGSSKGELQMNLAANSVSSSLLPMKAIHEEVEPASAYVGTQTVRVERLDEWAAPIVPARGNLFLKVDTQGYEKEVLAGASALLDRVAAIQLELSLIPLYENAPSFVEMVAYTEGLGYDLFGIVPGFKDVRSGRLLQVDGFFVRRGAGHD